MGLRGGGGSKGLNSKILLKRPYFTPALISCVSVKLPIMRFQTALGPPNTLAHPAN